MKSQVYKNGIGYRIKELRKKKGYTQLQLAKMIGCTQTTVAEWERRDDRAPGKNFRAKVAELLEVSIDYLVGMDREETPQIPCYGEIQTDNFKWQETASYYIEIPREEYKQNLFSLKIKDELLEPIIPKEDYGIFEKKSLPTDRDIVIVRFAEGQAAVKMWRQEENKVMLTEINLEKIRVPYFFEVEKQEKPLIYKIKRKKTEKIYIEGILIAVKKTLKYKDKARIRYIYT